MGRSIVRVVLLVALLFPVLAGTRGTADAAPIGNQYFERNWARTDKPVADGVLTRTWMWGPEAFTGIMTEDYAQAPGGKRTVQYFDKSRMEITHDQSLPTDSPWYVGNGLLARELMTGQMQVGDAQFQPREAARVNVAGDPDDTSKVTYWFMGLLQDQSPTPVGSVIRTILVPGAASNLYLFSDHMAAYGVTAAHYVPETGHSVAQPFWDFMNSGGTVYEQGQFVYDSLFENPFYATGLPLTDAYWAQVKLAGVQRDVLVQCFERRCLTYTPSNDPAWRVEAGNVGQHYFRWRYGVPTDPTPGGLEQLPGVTRASAIEHLRGMGHCGFVYETQQWTTMNCVSIEYPTAAYTVRLASPTPSRVLSIEVQVTDVLSNPSGNINKIGAFVLGWAASVSYVGADPDEAAGTVIHNIGGSGYFEISGVRFEINRPSSVPANQSPNSFWGNNRTLLITVSEPGG